jgi:hypothetical protein
MLPIKLAQQPEQAFFSLFALVFSFDAAFAMGIELLALGWPAPTADSGLKQPSSRRLDQQAQGWRNTIPTPKRQSWTYPPGKHGHPTPSQQDRPGFPSRLPAPADRLDQGRWVGGSDCCGVTLRMVCTTSPKKARS